MSLKPLIQIWVFVIASGVIGMIAINWNGSYEKGSAIDVIKTQVQRDIK